MADLNIDVDVTLSEDAKRIMRHQEMMEKQRLDTIADIYRFTVVQLLDYQDEKE